jgi:hypothetical protein
MFNIGSWNIWGLNSFHKQKTVQEWTIKNNLDIFGLLETKIIASNLDTIAPHLAISLWQYTTNITSSSSCRIFIGWNPHKLSLTHITSSSQWLTCEITTTSSPSTIRMTFVYGYNTLADRRTLWNYIAQESSQNTCTPWIVLGDFNAIMHASRLQLIKSVLFLIQMYWTSLFILPCTTIRKIESIFSTFLWKGSSLTHTRAKVAWQSICFPLREGGLGIKNLQT